MALRILTDSTSDFTKEELNDLNIDMVPLKVIFDGKEYKDGIDISIDEFYEKMEASKNLPTTSQPTPADFIDHFEAAKEANDEIIVFLISSELSGTYQSAMLAKNIIDYDKIYLFDTLNATVASRVFIETANTRRNEGVSVSAIIDELEGIKSSVTIKAALSTLDNLVKGGRLSKVAGFAGSLLSIKPIISIIDGKVTVITKARGKKVSFEAILREIEKDGGIDFNYPCSLVYAKNKENAEELQAFLQKNGIDIPRLYPIGSTIGTHAGPDAYGLAYVKKTR